MLIYLVGLICILWCVFDILKKPITLPGKLITALAVLLTSWVGIIVYYLWARHHIAAMFGDFTNPRSRHKKADEDEVTTNSESRCHQPIEGEIFTNPKNSYQQHSESEVKVHIITPLKKHISKDVGDYVGFEECRDK